jgi:hypothetical protein
MTATYALFRAFLAAFMTGLGVGIMIGFVCRLVKSVVSIVD